MLGVTTPVTALRQAVAAIGLTAVLWLGWAMLRPGVVILLGTTMGLTPTHLHFVAWWVVAGSIAVVALSRC